MPSSCLILIGHYLLSGPLIGCSDVRSSPLAMLYNVNRISRALISFPRDAGSQAMLVSDVSLVLELSLESERVVTRLM